MIVMVIFETVEGQTGKIVGHIGDGIKSLGHSLVKVDTADKRVQASFAGIDKVILAAPVHERRHPKTFELFVATSRDALNEHDTLMISVSLKAAFADGLEDAQDFLTEMEMRTGFSAIKRLLVAGAVRQGSYDYFASQILQHVVLAGQDPKLRGGDHEFTDWQRLDAEVGTFLAL